MSTVADVRAIVVLRANALGDFVFALPGLEALDAAYPHARITLIGRSWHRELVESRPTPIDEVVEVVGSGVDHAGDAPWTRASAEELEAFLAGMRRRRFDIAIQLHGGGANSNPFVAAFGARLTVGMRSPDAPRLDRTVPYVYYQPEVARLLEVVGLVGAEPRSLRPQLAVTTEDRQAAARVLGDDRPYVVLHPGASDPRRRWPAERFALVGDALADRGLRVVLTGTAAEAAATAAVRDRMRCEALDLAGRTRLPALVGLLADARAVVTNDTGPMHVAVAVGAPSVGIYWIGNLINGGPLIRTGHRPVVSWRRECSVCGTDCIVGRCDHDASFVDEPGVEEVLGATDAVLADPRQHSST